VRTILTITLNPALDLYAEVGAIVPNEKLRIHELTLAAGGGGVNVARVVAELGGAALAVVTVGGLAGQELLAALTGRALPVVPVAIDGETRRNLTIRALGDGEEYRFIGPGPALDDHEWHEVLHAVAAVQPAPDVVVLSGSTPPGVEERFVRDLADIALARQAKLVIDTSGPTLEAATYVEPALLKPNVRELSGLTGTGLADDRSDDERIAAGAAALLARGVGAVAVSLGERGAYAVDRHGSALRVTPPPGPVLTTAGAGDSMVAGMALAMTHDLPFSEVARWGVAAGTATTIRPGGALLERRGFELVLEQLAVEHLGSPAPGE